MPEPAAYRRLLGEAADYYGGKLRAHGATPRGVDWNDAASQALRFRELLRLLPPPGQEPAAATLCDLGCGYGGLLDHLRAEGRAVRYTGVDVSDEMIGRALALHGEGEDVRWRVGDRPDGLHDYVIASGIFNVRGDAGDGEWRESIDHTLDLMHAGSRLGFAFNCLGTCSDPERREPRLFYSDPGALLDACQRRFSRHVALAQDYGLYEFTLIVRKEPR